MDLHVMDAHPTDRERAAIDSALGPPITAWEAGPFRAEDGRVSRSSDPASRRSLLLPGLLAVQQAIGWISEGSLSYLSQRLAVPPAEAYGVATFYALLRTVPSARVTIHACDDVACRAAGSDRICDDLEAAYGPSGAGDEVTWHRSPCLGLCDRSPAVFVQETGRLMRSVASAQVPGLLAADRPPVPLPPAGVGAPMLLARVGRVAADDLDAARSAGAFAGLARAVGMGPTATIDEIERSGLRGRGGAAFPVAAKWRAVAAAPGDRLVVVNGDESEPGTFKDRLLMEGDPFAVVEGAAIAAFATGADRGFIYVRGEYPEAARRIERVVTLAADAGLLDHVVLEVRLGGGAYVCGEETALFRSIEGRRGEPSQKPPFPTTDGLFGLPTAINNVETLVAAAAVMAQGAAAFAAVGTEESSGPKLFAVSGAVAVPGVYEVPFGIRLGELLELAGGVAGGRALAAILLGGAAGTFVGPDRLDLELSIEASAAARAPLGSGAVIVFDDATDFTGIVRRIAAFFRDESCGKCIPCRIGTARQEEALARLDARGDQAAELSILQDLAAVMRDASICGLGQTASSAVASAVALGLIGRVS